MPFCRQRRTQAAPTFGAAAPQDDDDWMVVTSLKLKMLLLGAMMMSLTGSAEGFGWTCQTLSASHGPGSALAL